MLCHLDACALGIPPHRLTGACASQNSCVECVWNVYWRELHEYERALAAWEGRAPPQAPADPFAEMERRLEQEEEERRARDTEQPRPPKPDRPKVSHTGESYLVR